MLFRKGIKLYAFAVLQSQPAATYHTNAPSLHSFPMVRRRITKKNPKASLAEIRTVDELKKNEIYY